MFPSPPLRADATVALAAALATVNVLPAGGALVCYRLVQVHMCINRLSTGITDLSLIDLAPALFLLRGLGAQLTGNPRSEINWPEPGYQCFVNSALQFQTQSTVAAGTGAIVVYYYVDNVT